MSRWFRSTDRAPFVFPRDHAHIQYLYTSQSRGATQTTASGMAPRSPLPSFTHCTGCTGAFSRVIALAPERNSLFGVRGSIPRRLSELEAHIQQLKQEISIHKGTGAIGGVYKRANKNQSSLRLFLLHICQCWQYRRINVKPKFVCQGCHEIV